MANDSQNITWSSIIIIVIIAVLVLALLLACMWFNVYWRCCLLSRSSVVHIRVENQNIAQGNFLYPPHRTQPEEGQQQETLHGHALENRVRTRQHRFPRTYHLPDGRTVLHVDDFRRIPEAAPPPATEEGLQRQREEAERVPSPVFYGRSSYLLRSMSSIFSSFCFQATPETPAATSMGPKPLSARNKKDTQGANDDNNSPSVRRKANEPIDIPSHGVDDLKRDKSP
ncbi:hypothetical protein C3747_229g53 [Trypanosoma cruzi]|uniref:Uncharacterized protein n=2 Tax=Trypanosoma cruzi TaxID=5693 RepID=Q4D176_TRYCC|nr:hypothetical protein, conserved [Trypanosoma cruzi]EAN86275.1 hypothetical protein, conserved [Trypanosoma cruzi]PWU98545.1 hypothetical protein C3747_229g53 [Trypanosoma cruzi]RNC40726.1 hypothetical protein TcCL_NonESM09777 [Trypanosoma cruzi]|eukprot:XP_808126.1 hypothetical protein [Trypanosoma cruzi strain CL Brener]